MKIEGDMIIFSSGRRLYAQGGVVGISPNGIYQGYMSEFLQDEEISREEAIEFLDYMIAQWQELRDRWGK